MKQALIVLLSRYADWEIGYLAPMFPMSRDFSEDSGWKSLIVSLGTEPIASMGDLNVLPDLSVASAPETFDALILIGGLSWREESAKEVLPLVERAKRLSVPIAAICDAANFLAWHGYLDEVSHTGNAGGEMHSYEYSRYRGKKHFLQDARVVRDGGMITADGASATLFAAEVAKELELLPLEAVEEWLEVQSVGEKAYYE